MRPESVTVSFVRETIEQKLLCKKSIEYIVKMASPVTSNYELSIEYDVETINISIGQQIGIALKRMIIFTIFISKHDK